MVSTNSKEALKIYALSNGLFRPQTKFFFKKSKKNETILKKVNAIYFSDYLKMSSRSQQHIIK